MSDLFTTLAREAVGAPMAVAPRGRSRFEAPSLPLNLALESEETAAASPDAPRPHATPPRPENRTEPQESGDAPAQIARTVSLERVHRVEVENEIVARIESRNEPARAEREPASQMREPERAVPEPAQAALDEPAAASALPAPARTVERAQSAAIAQETHGQAMAAQATSPPVAPQRHAPLQVETIPPRAAVPGTVRPDTAARTHGEPGRAQLSPATRRPAQAPPTIHVTIGRVEVRAVTPPAAKPAPAAPKPFKPAMSLADYLEQRNRSG